VSILALSENLNYLMRVHGNLSVTELAKKTKVPQPTLHHILVGNTKKPRRNALDSLANFFSITVPQLIGELPLPHVIPSSIKEELHLTTVPIISWDTVINYKLQMNEIASEKTIFTDMSIHKDCFALVVRNDIAPIFPKGSIIIVDPSKRAMDRDYVIVHLKKTNQIIFNRLFIDNKDQYIKVEEEDGNAQLVQLKPGIDKIIATVVEARLQFNTTSSANIALEL
jgi:SOS-response transcriptional repressor LexA